MTGPPVNLLVDDESAANSAADIHVEERRITDARTETGFGQSRGIGVVLDNHHRYLEMVANPGRQRKSIPAFDLEGLLGASEGSVNWAAKADAGGLDVVTAEVCPGEQLRRRSLDLS